MPSFLKKRMPEENSVETWLMSKNPAQQELAAQTLARMSREQRMAYFLSLLRREEKAIPKRAALIAVPLFAVILTLAIALIHVATLRHRTSFPIPVYLLMNPAAAYLRRPSKLVRRVNELIAREADVSAISVVVKAWIQGGYADCNVPARSLARLLPQMSGADSALLDKAHWDFLMNWLSPRGGKALHPEVRRDFVRAILLACGNLGKTDALPKVKKLADTKTKDPEILQLQQTARNYVTLLEGSERAQPQAVCR